MSLEKRCAHEVAAADRERGRQYFQQRRIKIDASDDHGLNATVRGAGRTYEVQIDWFDSESSGILTASCHCPRYQTGHLCKHIWATLLMADQRGIGRRVKGKGDLQVFLESSDAAVLHTNSTDGETTGEVADIQTPWRDHFVAVRRSLAKSERGEGKTERDPRRLAHYRMNVLKSLNTGELVIDLFQRTGRDDMSILRPLRLTEREAAQFTNADDHELLSLLLATSRDEDRPVPSISVQQDESLGGVLPAVLYDTLLPRLCATGRFGWVNGVDDQTSEHHLLSWDEAEPWQFLLRVERLEDGEQPMTTLAGALVRDGERAALSDPLLLFPEGIVVFRDRVARFRAGNHFPWVAQLRQDDQIVVPESDVDAMLEDLWSMPVLPPLDLPRQWRLDEVHMSPVPGVSFTTSGSSDVPALDARLWLDYDGLSAEPIDADTAKRAAEQGRVVDRIVDRPHGRLVFRDLESEAALVIDAETKGLVRRSDGGDGFRVPMKDFRDIALHLIEDGWLVEAEGEPLRRASNANIALSVASNIDWFELEGDLEFGNTSAGLPALLAAIRRGDMFVRLDDGSNGLLPEEWIERYSALAANSLDVVDDDEEGESVRFLPSQTLLLDRLLEEEDVEVDRTFERIRDQLTTFDEVKPAKEPRGFRGELRTYQREGLGWLKFLKDNGFGGCLADDMGLGKTVQVLALLQLRRVRPVSAWERLPSLIVVPRSLVHNWIVEAAQFTPKLRLLNYTGPGREEFLYDFDQYDVVVTTYGTLRRDIEQLETMEFDYAILDEAQAIKNVSSQAAKACRRLNAHYRLALTGTPVENHLGELWSIFEFLNPGMLKQSVLRDLIGAEASSEALATVSVALKPFIFRRTKKEVLHDLPEKTELTLYCELEGKQLDFYKKLRDHYRAALEERIEQVGLKKSKIQVLEALLRLRQAACHPGLIEADRLDDSSAKLDALLQHLEEVLDEGHKALVFSQFTSLLAIVRRQLDEQGVTYEYLDGRTRNRQEKVDRFQNDADCRLFLISLKAGGVGLNLTAADYVFILDPWWNPAVEAQAVDRAHRIGQTRPVFAYRLISRGTVEEKILELQGNKKQLADAILSADKTLISDLSADDLKVLLS